MALKLKRKEGVEEGVQRVIRDGVTKAARGLQNSRAPAAAIHTARKRGLRRRSIAGVREAMSAWRGHEALQADAVELGDRVYAESPRRFVERVREFWKAWR